MENHKPKKELFRDLDRLRSEAITLRNQLNRLGSEKESWFAKKSELSRAIREKIGSVKEFKQQRDAFTTEVKSLKEKRLAMDSDTKGKISSFRKLDEEKTKLLSKIRVKNPSRIKDDIESLERKLETEVMPFEKEKQLSKKIKDLKKLLGDSSDALGMLTTTRNLNREISTGKKVSGSIHAEVQEKAKESQKLHESMISMSKEINLLEKGEKEAFRKFSELKKEFNKISSSLKEKLSEMGSLREQINRYDLEEREKKRLDETMLIQNKEKEIEQKFKSGKKLTTEDFLFFQESLKK